MVTSTLWAFNLDVYALLDIGATLSFLTPSIEVIFNVIQENLLELLSISPHQVTQLQLEGIEKLFCHSL